MRGNEFFQRITVAYNLIRYGKGKCRIMSCEKCKSILIEPISKYPVQTEYIDGDRHIDSLWSEIVQCMKCGAVCQEMQLWNFEGDATKIDKDFTVKEVK